jgi:hypothetical protein
MMIDKVDVKSGAESRWVDWSSRPNEVNEEGVGTSTQNFGATDPETHFHIKCSHSQFSKGGGQPRHRHVMDQFRFVLDGHVSYDDTSYGAGHCVYLPESVSYLRSFPDDDCRALGFQFPGPSGARKFTKEEGQRAREELEAQGVTFDGRYVVFPDGRKQDNYEATWEHLSGRKAEYAPPRYREPVHMYEQNFPWRPTRHRGISAKHLAYFNECGPNISFLKLDAGASTPAGTSVCMDLRLIVEGEVEYEGQTCPAVSRLFFPPDLPYEPISSRTGATILVFQVAVTDGPPPPLHVV